MQKLSQCPPISSSVKKCSKRAYLKSSLESLIYLRIFSLLTVTHLNTRLASNCTRVTIWSVLCLSVTSYSSGCSTKLPMQGVTRRIAALERDLFCVASTGSHYAHLPCGLADRHHNLLHLLHHACPGKLFPGLNLWLAREWSSDNFILRTRALWKLWTSFPDLSVMSSSRRSLITWSPGFASGGYDTNLVTAGLDMMEIGARQLNDWRLHELPYFLPFCQPGVPSNTPILSLAATSSLSITWSVQGIKAVWIADYWFSFHISSMTGILLTTKYWEFVRIN